MQTLVERGVLLGMLGGMRTSSPLVATSADARPREWYALLGEFIVDKLPRTPSRLIAPAWIARVGVAGFAAFRDPMRKEADGIDEVAVAMVTATVANKVFHDVRQALVKNCGIPDFWVALAEDALVLSCIVRLRDPLQPQTEG